MPPQITDEYAAAWIEARGRLQTDAGSNGDNRRPSIRVISLDPIVTEALAEHFDTGELGSFNPKHSPHMTLYTWQVRNVLAYDVLRRTVPYMITDLRDHAEYVLERAS
jgi:hypothetical protein